VIACSQDFLFRKRTFYLIPLDHLFLAQDCLLSALEKDG